MVGGWLTIKCGRPGGSRAIERCSARLACSAGEVLAEQRELPHSVIQNNAGIHELALTGDLAQHGEFVDRGVVVRAEGSPVVVAQTSYRKLRC